jgi:hypothetical protein
MPPCVALSHLVSTLSYILPRDTRLPYIKTGYPAAVEYRVGLFHLSGRTLVDIYFRTPRWIFVLQIWQLRYCRLRCVLVKLWFHLTPVLRNFRKLVSAYVVCIKPCREDRIPICFGQLEFSTERAILIMAYLSLLFTKLSSFRKLF